MRQYFSLIVTLALLLTSVGAMAQRPTDNLDRGLVAVYNGSGVFCSWRILADEYYGVKYNLYRNGTKLNSTPLDVSNYTDASGTTSSTYTVKTVVDGVEQDDACDAVSVWATGRVAKSTKQPAEQPNYLSIQMKDVVDRNGNVVFCCCGSHTPAATVAQNYTLNDCSMADLDGDGQMEIIVKRLNQSDASATDSVTIDGTKYNVSFANSSGTKEIYSTTNTRAFVLLEAYKLDGTRLWWIDCGPNMVSLNSTEIDAIAYDWDQDGKAEVVLRGADNMIIHESDGTSYTVGSSSVNTRNALNSHSDSQYAWTHTGSEYLIYMNGTTGVPYQVMTYPLKRLESGESSENTAWGDGYGHRSSKYFFGAPFLDGRKASLFLARGIYTRHKMIAYDIDSNHNLTEKWSWSNNTSGSDWYGQGYHNYSIADVDGDGCDEIVYGSMVIDNNGKGLSTTGLGHGDAQHVGDFDPYRKGLEVFACNEDKPGNNYRNATTSDIYYRNTAAEDDGRAMMANFSNDYPGCVGRSVSSSMISSVTNGLVSELGGDDFINWADLNWPIYWDGDLCSEYFESPGTEGDAVVYKPSGASRLMQTSGCKLNNDSKNNPCFVGDVLGDWREEILVRQYDNTALRLFTTTTATNYRVPCLWYDPEYRQSMVWQMCAYNQPPHVSYFMGEMEGLTKVPVPLTMKNRTEIAATGDCIPTSANGSDVIAYGLANVGIPTAGVSPRTLIMDVPSTVSGSGSNSGISYSYSTTQLGYGDYKGKLTGAMNLVKQGDGLLKITANTFDYTGKTDIYAGSVQFRGKLTASPVWMNRHTILYTAGTFNRAVTMEYGSTLNLNKDKTDGTVEYSTAAIDTLNLHEGARVVFNIDPSTDSGQAQSDTLNMKRLSIRKQSWSYGPTYSAPVLQITSTAALAAGHYLIGTLNSVDGSLDDLVIEGSFADNTTHKLMQSDGKLYLLVSGATTVGNTDNTSTWWTAFSDNYTMKKTQRAHITFTNYSDKSENFHNWMLAFANVGRGETGYTEYNFLRADNYGWGTYYDPAGLSSAFNWTTFQADMDGATVDMYLTVDYGRLNMTSTITTTSGTVYNYSYKTLILPTLDQYSFFFTVEKSHMENLTVSLEDYTPAELKSVATASETLVGLEDNTTTAWTYNSATYTVKKNQMAVVKFTNYSDKAANWDNWNIVFPDHMTLRADAYGWGANGKSTAEKKDSLCNVFTNNLNWDNFKSDMDGAAVEMKIYPLSNCIHMQASITPSSSTTSYYYNFVSTAKENMDDFTFYFSPEKAHMTNLTVTTYGIPYNVTYHNNGHGTAPDAIVTDYLPNPLPTMTEDGYTFDGWYTDEALTTAAVAGASITANTDLYAKWSDNNNWSLDVSTLGITTDQAVATASVEVSDGLGTVTLNGASLDSRFGLAAGSDYWKYRTGKKGLENLSSGSRMFGVFNAKAGQHIILNSSASPASVSNATLKVTDGNVRVYKVTADGTVKFVDFPRYEYIYSIEVSDEYYTFSVTGKTGETTTTIASGYAKKGTEVTKYWSKYVKAGDGVWYAVDGTEFGATFTESTEKTVECTASTVSQFIETSDMTISRTYGTIASNADYSNGNGVGLFSSATMITKTTVPAGTYDLGIYSVVRNAGKTDGFNIYTSTDGTTWSETAAGSITIAAGTGLSTTTTPITLTETSYIKFENSETSNQNHYVDYVTFAPIVYYTLTYHNNDHGTCPETATVSKLPNPLPTMTEDNFTFVGWYTDEALTTPAVAGASITADTHLYAKWISSNWTADFSTVEGASDKNAPTLTTVETISNVNYGTVVIGSTSFDSRLALAENGSWLWRSGSKALQNYTNGTRNLLVMNAKAGQYIQLNSNHDPESVSNATLQSTDGNVRTYKVDAAGNVMFSIVKTDGSDQSFIYSIKVFDGYTWTAKTSLGGTLGSGYVTKGESATVAYPKYVNNNGTLYTKDATDKTYKTTITPTKDNDECVVEYEATDITDVVYFAEAEKIEGATADATGTNMAGRSSNAQCAYATSDLTLTNLPAGKYKVTTVQYANSSSGLTLKYQVGDQTIENSTVDKENKPCSNNWDEHTNEFSIAEAADFKWLTSGSAKNGLDYIYITGTPTNTIIGALDKSTGYRGAKGSDITLAKGDTYYVKFQNHGTVGTSWFNWLLDINTNSTLAGTMRADWFLVAGAEGMTTNGSFTDGGYKFSTDGGATKSTGNVWDTFSTDMEDATVELTLAYSDAGVLSINGTATKNNDVYYYDYTISKYTPSGGSETAFGDNVTLNLSVEKAWLEILGYNGYSPTTLTLAATDGTNYWATLSNDDNVLFIPSANATVKTATVSNGTMSLPELTKETFTISGSDVEGYFVPKSTGVLVKASGTSVAYYTVTGKSVDALEGNMLYPASKDKSELSGYKFYMLAYASSAKDKLGFYWGAANGGAFTSRSGGAYLAVPTTVSAKTGWSFNLDDSTTAIENINANSYDNAPDGKYIKNDKLIIVKNGKQYNATGHLIK